MTDKPAQNPLGTKPIGKLIISYAVPGIVSMLVNALYNIIDQIFIGHSEGYLGNSATTVVFPLITAGLAISLLMGAGCSAFVSLKLGEGKRKIAEKALGNMITMLLIIGVSFSVIAGIFLEPILSVLGATEKFMGFALDYAAIILIGQPAIILTTGLSNAIRADGSPRYSMICMLVGAGINTALDPIFIFTLGMGIKGAALATIISQFISLIMAAAYFARQTKNISFHFENLKLEKFVTSRLVSLGLSSFLTQLAAMILQIVMNNLLRHYGELSPYGAEIAISGAGIIMKVNAIMISVLVGISIGAQPILGYNYGAGNFGRVKKTYLVSVSFASVLAVVCWAFFMAFPQRIVAVFGDNTEVFVEFCTLGIHSMLALMFLAGFQIISANYFQAVGHPMKAIALSVSRQILFLIPISILMGHIWGLSGVLYSTPVSDLLASCVTAGFIIAEMKRLSRLEKDAENIKARE